MWDHKIGQLHCTLYTNISVLCAINSLGRKTTVLESSYLEHLQEIYPEIAEESTLTKYERQSVFSF